jgi:hypothetical protein
MTGIAVGQMGLSLETFRGLTPQQFNIAYEKFIERLEADDIQAERRARLAAFRTVCPPPGKKLKLYDFWHIKGDEEIKKAEKKAQKPSSQAKFNQLKNKWR